MLREGVVSTCAGLATWLPGSSRLGISAALCWQQPRCEGKPRIAPRSQGGASSLPRRSPSHSSRPCAFSLARSRPLASDTLAFLVVSGPVSRILSHSLSWASSWLLSLSLPLSSPLTNHLSRVFTLSLARTVVRSALPPLPRGPLPSTNWAPLFRKTSRLSRLY